MGEVIVFEKAKLEDKLKKYEADNWEESDALMDLYEQGYTVDSFRYDVKRYEWAKRIAEAYGLI